MHRNQHNRRTLATLLSLCLMYFFSSSLIVVAMHNIQSVEKQHSKLLELLQLAELTELQCQRYFEEIFSNIKLSPQVFSEDKVFVAKQDINRLQNLLYQCEVHESNKCVKNGNSFLIEAVLLYN